MTIRKAVPRDPLDQRCTGCLDGLGVSLSMLVIPDRVSRSSFKIRTASHTAEEPVQTLNLHVHCEQVKGASCDMPLQLACDQNDGAKRYGHPY